MIVGLAGRGDGITEREEGVGKGAGKEKVITALGLRPQMGKSVQTQL